ncbi:autotransporter outer membrane beta-barrel domain-containing protein [Spongorhabdus nitratireducens]
MLLSLFSAVIAKTSVAGEVIIPIPNTAPVPDPAHIKVDPSQVYNVNGQLFVRATQVPSWLTTVTLPGGVNAIPLPLPLVPGASVSVAQPPNSTVIASRLTIMATLHSFANLTRQLRQASAASRQHDQQLEALMKKRNVRPEDLPDGARPMLDEEDADSNRFVRLGDQVIEMGPWHTFFNGYGISAKEDDEKSLPGYDLGGFGVDLGIYNSLNESWALGVMIGGQKQDADLHHHKGHVEVDTLRVGPFASWKSGSIHADMAVTYAHNDVSAKQNYSYAIGKASYDYQEVNLYVGTGYDISLDEYTSGLMMTPEASFLYVFSDYDKFNEKTSSSTLNVRNRQVSPESRGDWSSRLGVSMNYNGLQFEWPTEVFIGAGWQHNHFDDQKIKCDNGGVLKDHYDENEAYYRLGINSMLNNCLSLEVGYQGTHGSNMTSHTFNAGLNYRF